MSGFRDDELDKKLNEVGANLTSAVSKNTFAVIVKDKEEETGKTTAAKEKNIPIYTIDEFKEKYELE